MARRRGTPSSGSRQVLSVGFTVLVLVVLASLYIVREAFGVDLIIYKLYCISYT